MWRFNIAVMFVWSVGLPLSGQILGQNNPPAIVNPADSSLPAVVRFSGTLRELDGTIHSGLQGVTFSLYKDQAELVPIWSETQTVSLDNRGHFTVLLGSTNSNGVLPSAFSSGESKWIGITPEDRVERPRVELSTVPYAFKAADADMVEGKHSAEFVTQEQLTSLLNVMTTLPPVVVPSSQVSPDLLVPHLNADLLHGLSDSAFAKLRENNVFLESQIFQSGIEMPAASLEPNSTNVFDSAPLDFESSSSDPQAVTPVKQRFRWLSQPLSGVTTGPIARLSLLFGANRANPSPTGLSINSDGTINFAPGQQIPAGAIVSTPGSGDTGSGTGTGTVGREIPIVNTAGYSWNQAPLHASALQVGTNTVMLTPCPRGVNGTDVWHYLYISGTGTPEVVLITGGSCISGTQSGTIEFTASYPHPVGYFIGSATDGVQEAVNNAAMPNTGGQISRQVLIDPGSHLFRARLSIRSSGMIVMSSGATVTCAMSDTCIMMGDPSNADTFQSIVVQGLRIAAGVKSGTWPAVEDNAQGSTITNYGPAASPVAGASFGSLAQIDNDQAATIDGLNTSLSYTWGRCDATFCSTAIVGPGPYSKNAGVLWVKNSNISLQCVGNGIDNQNGNTLNLADSVVQGYAQFGIRARTVYSPDTIQENGVYEEEDGYCNPLGTGSSGLIVEGGKASAYGSPSAGLLPQFANTGSTQYFYYIVVHSSTLGTSPAYIAGQAATSGLGLIPVVWNRVGNSGDITYDVLRIAGDGGADMHAPYGTGAFAVAVGVPAISCSSATCSVLDDPSSRPASYTVSDNTVYWPSLKLWPGTVILTTAFDTQNSGGGNPTTYFTDSLPHGAIINSAGSTYPSVFAQECEPQGNWSSIWMQCLGGNSAGNDYAPITATVLQMSNTGGSPGGLKGREIFAIPTGSSIGATHVITLADSDFDKTLATPNNRPPWDSNDTFIGYDQPQGVFPNKIQLSLGAPVSISRYIANTGDNINFLERLTSQQEEFRVPVLFQSVAFSQLLDSPNGTLVYCSDCGNSADDGAAFDSPAAGDGHGTTLLRENGQWRVH